MNSQKNPNCWSGTDMIKVKNWWQLYLNRGHVSLLEDLSVSNSFIFIHSLIPFKAKLVVRVCYRSQCLLKRWKYNNKENIAALFVRVLLTNLVSLYTKSAVYCLISPDTSRTVALLGLAAVDFTVSHCSTREVRARKMPLCENATYCSSAQKGTRKQCCLS